MKVILSLNKQVDPGWIKPTDPQSARLDQFDIGELDELVLDEILERNPINEVANVISFYGQKVKRGGYIKLMGPDLNKWSEAITTFEVTHTDFAKTFFKGFLGALSITHIISKLPQGFRLVSWDYNDKSYIITLERL